MSKRNYSEKKVVPNWRLFIALIQLTVVIIVLAFGYLLLEDTIVEWINQKELPVKKVLRNKNVTDEIPWNKVVNGIHVRTGLHDDPNLQIIIGACTSCHSAKLITQNKATRAGWEQMIRWMQQTQNLSDLGDQEPILLDYLAKYYAPSKEGRRTNIDINAIEWYVLDLEGSSASR